MIPALAFVGGAATMWGAMWFIDWLMFAPIETTREPHLPYPFGDL